MRCSSVFLLAGSNRLIWNLEWIFVSAGSLSVYVTGPFFLETKNSLTLTWLSPLLSCLERRFFVCKYTLSPFLSWGAVFLFLLTYKILWFWAWSVCLLMSLWIAFISSANLIAALAFGLESVCWKRFGFLLWFAKYSVWPVASDCLLL
jgi:hypothetical protein